MTKEQIEAWYLAHEGIISPAPNWHFSPYRTHGDALDLLVEFAEAMGMMEIGQQLTTPNGE